MQFEQFMPTVFAKKLARFEKLYSAHEDINSIKDEKEQDHAEYLHEKLAEFQKMSIGGEFEEALIVYTRDDISDEQETALRIIHKQTKVWVRGYIAERLMNSIEKDPKSMAGIANQIVALMKDEIVTDRKSKTDKGKSSDDDEIAQIIFKVAKHEQDEVEDG